MSKEMGIALASGGLAFTISGMVGILLGWEGAIYLSAFGFLMGLPLDVDLFRSKQ